ncbi:hypothetical protein AHiyo4_04090 [Arthrobacter sp. Hiyo4]|nr:hypothetical protein AHiyo4_04090 [Arthrobacter sp. Hiyo4]
MRRVMAHARTLHALGPANNDRLSAVRVAVETFVGAVIGIAVVVAVRAPRRATASDAAAART